MRYRTIRVDITAEDPGQRVFINDVSGDRVERRGIPTVNGIEGWMHYPVAFDEKDTIDVPLMTDAEALEVMKAEIITKNEEIILKCIRNSEKARELKL